MDGMEQFVVKSVLVCFASLLKRGHANFSNVKNGWFGLSCICGLYICLVHVFILSILLKA